MGVLKLFQNISRRSLAYWNSYWWRIDLQIYKEVPWKGYGRHLNKNLLQARTFAPGQILGEILRRPSFKFESLCHDMPKSFWHADFSSGCVFRHMPNASEPSPNPQLHCQHWALSCHPDVDLRIRLWRAPNSVGSRVFTQQKPTDTWDRWSNAHSINAWDRLILRLLLSQLFGMNC